jgi:hypothetical protein
MERIMDAKGIAIKKKKKRKEEEEEEEEEERTDIPIKTHIEKQYS